MIKFYLELLGLNREIVKLTIKIFLVSVVIGAVGFLAYPQLLTQILGIFAEKFGETPELSVSLAQEIFLNNLIVASLSLFGGAVLGLLSVLTIIVNGYIIGFIFLSIFFVSGQTVGENLWFTSLALVPHGIFELPAFIFAAAFGLSLGTGWLKGSAQGQKWQVFRGDLTKAFKIFPLIVLLLLIAAFIEVFVSGFLVDKF